MWFRRSDEKELRMIWRAGKTGRSSFLVGTAHFFPYCFKTSLTRLYRQVETVLFEGPLDDASMQAVVQAGLQGHDACLLPRLDRPMLERIARALGMFRQEARLLRALQLESTMPPTVEAMIQGMRPWMAFFTIYTRFAAQQGWKHSVDMEAYQLARKMKKKIAFLETIDEQVEVLDGLSLEQILDYLRRIDEWGTYMNNMVTWYSEGDLDQIASNPYGFPTRNAWVIDRRDEIMYQRMLPYLEQGKAAVFVGSPHLVGIRRLLQAGGYEVRAAADSLS
jgi:uncharacterized protein YbaP (TraB family)